MRPATEPAASIFDVFVKESQQRKSRDYPEWIQKELEAVHQEACEQAEKLGLTKPTLQEVQQAEILASGHSDYGRQWAMNVTDIMKKRR